jgi:very-short-patch-repair endonuclease
MIAPGGCGELCPPEAALWARLRQRVPDRPVFRRQHPIGPYIADFYCSAVRLVIEIDGWGDSQEEAIAHDQSRDFYMERAGYRVIRVWAGDVMADADEAARSVFDTVMGALG